VWLEDVGKIGEAEFLLVEELGLVSLRMSSIQYAMGLPFVEARHRQ